MRAATNKPGVGVVWNVTACLLLMLSLRAFILESETVP